MYELSLFLFTGSSSLFVAVVCDVADAVDLSLGSEYPEVFSSLEFHLVEVLKLLFF